MRKQQEQKLLTAYQNMSDLDRVMLLSLAESRSAAWAQKQPQLRLVTGLGSNPASSGSFLRTAS